MANAFANPSACSGPSCWIVKRVGLLEQGLQKAGLASTIYRVHAHGSPSSPRLWDYESLTVYLRRPQDAQLEVAALWEPSLIWEAPSWLRGPVQASACQPSTKAATHKGAQPTASSSSSSSSSSDESSDADVGKDDSVGGLEVQQERDEMPNQNRGMDTVATANPMSHSVVISVPKEGDGVSSDSGSDADTAKSSGDGTSSSESEEESDDPAEPSVIGFGGGLWQADTARTDLFSRLDDVLAVAGSAHRRNALQLLQKGGVVGSGGIPRASVRARAPAVFKDPAPGSNPVHVRAHMPPTGAL